MIWAALHAANSEHTFELMVAPEDDTVPLGISNSGPRFTPGNVVAGRYTIVRYIARGGMGEVYEAEDTQLNERIALKVLRAHGGDAASVERFKREIQLSRKVTHPNVCRIFDLGVHLHPINVAGDVQEIIFLTMELLRGETLAKRLKRDSMSTTEVLELARSLAAGLDAAHASGIIHRDFKASNVMFDGDRVVITDFGLAVSHDSPNTPLTAHGRVVGTPAYMAPEQMVGAEVTPAADIYAFGIVLYHMLTGVVPFKGDDMIKRKVQGKAVPASSRVNIDPRWDAVLARCLAPSPRDRYPSAQAVVDALDALRAKKKKKANPWPAALIAFALIAGSATGYAWYRPMLRARALRARPIVAILGLKNVSGREDVAWISTALSEMLTTELSAGEKLRVVSGQDVTTMLRDLALQDVETCPLDVLPLVREHAGADYLIVGSYIVAGTQLRFDVRVQDARTGEVIASTAETGAAADVLTLVPRIGARVRKTLGLDPSSTTEHALARASMPNNPEAAQHYGEGLALLRAGDGFGARVSLEHAATLDPESPLIHASLSEALQLVGHEEGAKTAAEKAFRHSSKLPRADRLLITGIYRERAGDWDAAIESYQTLFEFFPGDVDYGVRLMLALARRGRGADALAIAEQLRRRSAEDPRIALGEALAAERLADYPRAEQAAARAAEQAKARGARMLASNALVRQAWALVLQGRFVDVGPVVDEAEAIARSIDDRVRIADALNVRGSSLLRRADYPAALRTYQNILEIAQKLGARSREAVAWANIGLCHLHTGELAAAASAYERAVAIHRELGREADAAHVQIQLSATFQQKGELTRALGYAEGSVGVAERLGDRALLDGARSQRARVLYDLGELAASRRDLEQVLASAVESRAGEYEAYARMNLGLLSIEEGSFALAEPLVTRAIEHFDGQKQREAGDFARSMLLRIHLGRGEIELARALADELLSHELDRYAVRTRASVLMLAARAKAASEDVDAARALVKRAIEEMASKGSLWDELESRLALGEIEIATGRVKEGRARLALLEREARAKGYQHIARKARSAGRYKAGARRSPALQRGRERDDAEVARSLR